MSILQTIKSKFRAAEVAKLATWREIVREIGDDKPVNESDVAGALSAAGKSIADLEADVSAYQKRKSLAALIAECDAAATEMPKLQKAHAAACDKLRDAERIFQETMNPIAARIEAIVNLNAAAKRAKQELRDSCNDPELQAAIIAAGDVIDAAARKRRDIEERCNRIESQLSGLTGDARKAGESQLAERRKDLADAQAECDAAVAAQNELVKRKLIP
jgi:hypothetical protein